MKVVYVTVKLEVPDNTSNTAGIVAAILAYGLKNQRVKWKVLKAQ